MGSKKRMVIVFLLLYIFVVFIVGCGFGGNYISDEIKMDRIRAEENIPVDTESVDNIWDSWQEKSLTIEDMHSLLLCIFIERCVFWAERAVVRNIDNVQDRWQESSLTIDEAPPHDYFINASMHNYILTLESSVADAVKDYSQKAGLENEKWKLERILYSEGIYYAFVESENENELYILIDDVFSSALEKYIVAADIRKNDEGDISLRGYSDLYTYSYNTTLEWNSYEDVEINKYNNITTEAIGSIYNLIFENGGYYALCDYLGTDSDIYKNVETDWKVDHNDIFIGKNGYLAYICFFSDIRKIEMFIDVRNKLYTIIKETNLQVENAS